MPTTVFSWEPKEFLLRRAGDPAELVVHLSNLSAPTHVRCFVHPVTVTINGQRSQSGGVLVKPDERGNGIARFTIVPQEEGVGEIRMCTVSNIAGLVRGHIVLRVGSVTEHTADEINTMLGPAGPKEFAMADPAEPAKKSPWIVFLGILTALGIVVGIAVGRMPSKPEETVSPEPAAEPVAAVPAVPEPVIPARVPVPDPTPPPAPVAEPEPLVVAAVEPTPVPEPPAPVAVEPVRAEPEPPKAVVKTEPPKSDPPKAATPAPKTVPTSLVVSSMGSRPSCVADCIWGDLAENGFPKTTAGKRTVTCSDGVAWLITTATKIERGPQARCYTAGGISAP